ncbi:uncharacterized protein LOC130805572 [Amaranthus tricolor]|uniref:uncharacterized protein LOC130805572 n=1 Tax=Amaranthus tricolor TaxID=29722 RepID=UPI0025870D8B|nr:uncharacterized protein LOC130805572 [Amaranthus tricolor]
MKGGNWILFNPSITSSWVVKKLCKVKDKLLRWMNTPTYSITKVYNDLRGGGSRVGWNHFVRNRLTTPRSRFINWLAFNNRLKTKLRLKIAGVVGSDTCPICELESETVNHLFFQCPFIQKCVAKLKEWYETNSKIKTLEDILRKNRLTRHRRKQFEATLCNLIYVIWSARNDAVWNHKVPLVNQVVDSVKDALETKFKFLASLRYDPT